MDAPTLGDWIAAARTSRGWTQSQLGDKLGASKANVSHWETNKHEPSVAQLLRIRDLTGYPLRDFGAALSWPFPLVPRERLTSLDEHQLVAVQAGLIAMLAALTPPALNGKQAAA